MNYDELSIQDQRMYDALRSDGKTHDEAMNEIMFNQL